VDFPQRSRTSPEAKSSAVELAQCFAVVGLRSQAPLAPKGAVYLSANLAPQ
jgi:hypothetical protein